MRFGYDVNWLSFGPHVDGLLNFPAECGLAPAFGRVRSDYEIACRGIKRSSVGTKRSHGGLAVFSRPESEGAGEAHSVPRNCIGVGGGAQSGRFEAFVISPRSKSPPTKDFKVSIRSVASSASRMPSAKTCSTRSPRTRTTGFFVICRRPSRYLRRYSTSAWLI